MSTHEKIKINNHDLDELDLKLLKTLQLDASLTNDALATKLHSSPATCLRRVNRLKSLGFIQKEVVIVNANLFTETVKAIIEITLEKQTNDVIERLEKLLIKETIVKQCYRVAANSDLVIIALVRNMSEYHDFVQRVLTGQNSIRNVRTLFITHQAKFDTSIPI